MEDIKIWLKTLYREEMLIMAEMSKKIRVYDEKILSEINPETMKLWNKYKIDMSLIETIWNIGGFIFIKIKEISLSLN